MLPCSRPKNRKLHIVAIDTTAPLRRQARKLALIDELLVPDDTAIQLDGTTTTLTSREKVVALEFSLDQHAKFCKNIRGNDFFDHFSPEEKCEIAETRARLFAFTLKQALAVRKVRAMVSLLDHICEEHLAQRVYAALGES